MSRIVSNPWWNKFAHAWRGLRNGSRGQSSFLIHYPAALLVVGVAACLSLTVAEWGLLVLSIAAVIAAELFNTSIELLVRRLHPEHDADVGRALDIAAAGVLVAALGAATVGCIVLGQGILRWLN